MWHKTLELPREAPYAFQNPERGYRSGVSDQVVGGGCVITIRSLNASTEVVHRPDQVRLQHVALAFARLRQIASKLTRSKDELGRMLPTTRDHERASHMPPTETIEYCV